ncbi:MAG: 23S rRNA pseudouridine(2604) synthase RluF [Gammaproteobacteria bacterium]|nr:23S rRNA pseudouridine(2604) synthase RluF [Gammaproteobacteria bacterium]
MSTDNTLRLNKFISDSGICSRRDADRFIEQGNVYINQRRAQVGDRIGPGDRVRVNGQWLEGPADQDHVLIALNKPVGIVSTTERSEPNNIVDFVNHPRRIFPIGRLDKDSQGLIFMTSNGDWVNKILRAGNQHQKRYHVRVNRPFGDEFISAMASGVPILGVTTKRCIVNRLSANSFEIVLVQGLNRQIRRMVEHFGFEVIKLERVQIMNVVLKGLPIGEWRDIEGEERDRLLASLNESSGEAPMRGRSAPKKRTTAPGKRPSTAKSKPPSTGRGKPNKGETKTTTSRTNSTRTADDGRTKGRAKDDRRSNRKPAQHRSKATRRPQR